MPDDDFKEENKKKILDEQEKDFAKDKESSEPLLLTDELKAEGIEMISFSKKYLYIEDYNGHSVHVNLFKDSISRTLEYFDSLVNGSFNDSLKKSIKLFIAETWEDIGTKSKSKTKSKDDIKNQNVVVNKLSITEELVDLAINNDNILKLFRDQYGTAFAQIRLQDHNQIVALETSKFKQYLYKIYYDEYDEIPNAEATNSATQMLIAKALFDGPTIHLSLRVAFSKDKSTIYYDLTNDNYQIVEVSKTGWEIKTNQDILFTRYNQTPQVLPDRNYDDGIFDEYIKSTNVKGDSNKLLLKVYIVSLFIPDIPHPIFDPHGEKGSGKSTEQTKIKRLVDPAKPELLTVNSKKEEFVQQLDHNHVAYYDNIKHVPIWLSDEVCKAVTGVGNTKRKLYTDNEDIVYEYKRCIGFNGVNIALTEPDALDRSIMIELERIKKEDRRLESDLYEEFETICPKLLGYIFDIIVKTLQIKDSIKLDNLPRMADFALWGESIARVMGSKPLDFINAYYENIGKQNIEVIDSDPLGQTIAKLCETVDEWDGPTSECLVKLREVGEANHIDTNARYFPKSANSLTRRINKIRSNLLEGLNIEVTPYRDAKNASCTKIRIIPPIPPDNKIPPESQNSCSDSDKISGGISLSGGIVSPVLSIPPVQNDINRAQIASDIDDSGGPEVPEVLLQPPDESENPTQTHFEKPEVCPKCDRMISPFDKNVHAACCNKGKV